MFFSCFKKPVGNSGFGLAGIITALIILSVMAAAALPRLKSYYEIKQAGSAINMANGLINAEIQYQLASYSNYAENNSAAPGGDYFGSINMMVGGLKVISSGKTQQFLPDGASVAQAAYGSNRNCMNAGIGGKTVSECLVDESDGQFELEIFGLNSYGLPALAPMFENGIKGGITENSGGILTTQVSVPFGFSAYPNAGKGSGSSANTGGTSRSGSGGGGNPFTEVPLGNGGYVTVTNNGAGGAYVIGSTGPSYSGAPVYYGNTCIAGSCM